MALRLSREASLLDAAEPIDEVSALPSVARVLAKAPPRAVDDNAPRVEDAPEGGDDDTEDELDAFEQDDFYADALEDA